MLVRGVIEEAKILDNCQYLMEFKAAGGRGLPWSLKKEIAILQNLTR